MTDPLSLEDANDVKGFDSLEERIVRTERDHDREVNKSIRLEYWQLSQIDSIKDRIGTNRPEVVLRAYSEGLYQMRREMGDLLTSLDGLNMAIRDCLMEHRVEFEVENQLLAEFNEIEVEENRPSSSRGGLTDPYGFPLKDSELSEVEDSLCVDLRFGGWVHRTVITFGLSESEFLSSIAKDKAKETKQKFIGSVQQTKKMMERLFYKYVMVKMGDWVVDGIDEQNKQYVLNAYSEMDTEYRAKCGRLLEEHIELEG